MQLPELPATFDGLCRCAKCRASVYRCVDCQATYKGLQVKMAYRGALPFVAARRIRRAVRPACPAPLCFEGEAAMRVSDLIGPDPTTEPSEVVEQWYKIHPTDTKLIRVCYIGTIVAFVVISLCMMGLAFRPSRTATTEPITPAAYRSAYSQESKP